MIHNNFVVVGLWFGLWLVFWGCSLFVVLVVGFFSFFNEFLQDCSLCLQGSDLLYEIEVPGPPTVLALSNGNGGNKILNIHIINKSILLYL